MKWIQDLLDNCVYCKSHRKDLLVMILVVFILSSFLFLSWVYLMEREEFYISHAVKQ